MTQVEQQHAQTCTSSTHAQVIGKKRHTYAHRDEEVVSIPQKLKEALFSPAIRDRDWQWVDGRQTEFADKGFIPPLLKLFDMCGDVKTVCDLTVGCGGLVLPLLHARPHVCATAFDYSVQCVRACKHNAACLNVQSRCVTFQQS